MSVDSSGVTDDASVELNEGRFASPEGPTRQRDDGSYEYPEDVKGPADHDTFEVNPNLVEEDE